jgi:C_GCAxxG_C_C family probable redox protein
MPQRHSEPPSHKLELVDRRITELMEKYHNCAQCTLVAIQEFSGLKNDELAKASSGLAGGIGGLQSVCGVLTGASLVLGLKYGRDTIYLSGPAEEALHKQGEVIEQVARLAKWFEREFGSIICDDLRRSHMGTSLSMAVPWQNEWAVELGMGKRCQEFAARTARRTLVMLDNPNLNIREQV